MSTVATDALQIATRNEYASAVGAERIALALFGLGNVGAAVADLARCSAEPAFLVTGALVRDTARPRTARAVDGVAVTTSPEALLDARPDAVVEVLGGLEPARALVLEALQRGIPVITANKSLLATHGDELLAAAANAGITLRYEATVIAGVPFLGTFARRPLASAISSFAGVVNGTSNFILSKMAAERATYAGALHDAQDRGLAEPDPAKDVSGVDAAEKLCILLRHFGRWSVRPCDVETSGIDTITAADLQQAAAAGGVIRPVVFATWKGSAVTAFAGPAFLPVGHPLAAIHGLTNGIVLGGGPAGDLFLSGAGAGPAVTAATILDDVAEAVAEARAGRHIAERSACRPALPSAPETRWFLRISASTLSPAPEIADLLAAHGVWLQRTSETAQHEGVQSRWAWTYPCSTVRVDRALRALSAACNCKTLRLRALEA
jgi:homoserine dehydrogenase